VTPLRQGRSEPPHHPDHDLARTLVHELSAAFSPREAAAEVRLLLESLRVVLRGPGLRRLRVVLMRAARRWRRRGLGDDALARMVLQLAVPGMSGTVPHAVPWPGLALRTLVDAVPIPMIAGDRELRVTACNAAFEELVHGSNAALAGRPLSELLGPECREDLPRQLRAMDANAAALQVGRVTLASVPGVEFLGTWVPLVGPDGVGAWLLRLASGPAASFEALGGQLRREESQKEKFTALLTVSNAVGTSLELDQILDTIAREAGKVLQVDECTVFLLDEAQNVLVPAACDVQEFRDEIMAIRLPVGQGVTGNVVLAGKGEIVNSALDDPRAVQVPGTPVEQSALLCVPLLVREKVAGAITLTRAGGRIFQNEDLELATLFAGQCSAAISNARLYEEVRRAYHELREAQSQLVQSAKLNALGEMAGGVAHDFNNILAAILGRAQLLLQSVSDASERRQLEVIERAALDGAQAVRRVQEFTRLRQDEHFEALDVQEVLQGVLELTRPAWEAESKRRGITLAAALDLRAAQFVAGNASELREVFTNLILNALDAMPWGGTLTLSSTDADGGVCIRVTDTGVGMDAATRERIFDPFFTTKPVKGTGLGLSVAYGIITRHHGRIEVGSEPGRGSVFSVWLPAALARQAKPETAPDAPLPRLRVLAVDDEEPVVRVLGDLLAVLGQEVEITLGGAAALERYSPERFDVVFTDLGMPEVNGWDVVQAVKSRSPDTPVVIVTGWGAQIEGRALHARGADYVIPKPFSLEDVREVLRQLNVRPARAA
jgi:signal transduction histidine kinase/ActR/RegA family two-component response regulator/PAS domain-containing protein